MPYAPYTESELTANPSLKDGYYNLGSQIFFKKVSE